MAERTPKHEALRLQLAFGSNAVVLFPLLMGITIVPLAVTLLKDHPLLILPAIVAQLGSIVWMLLTAIALVTVGHDGVLVRRVVERRFLRFSEMASVEEIDGEKLRITLRAGGHYDLFTHKDQNAAKIGYEERCAELLDRIRAGIAAHAHDEERLARAEAIVARARADAKGGYRDAEPASREELWSVASDATVPPALRARAAAAVRRDMGPAARHRLARIASGTAEPGLVKALRIAADAEDEAALAEVEAALDEEEARRRA